MAKGRKTDTVPYKVMVPVASKDKVTRNKRDNSITLVIPYNDGTGTRRSRPFTIKATDQGLVGFEGSISDPDEAEQPTETPAEQPETDGILVDIPYNSGSEV